MNGQTKLKWLRCATAVAVVERKNEALMFGIYRDDIIVLS